MGIFDKAKDAIEDNADKIAEGVEKATDFVDEKTKGKYSDKLDKVDEMAEKLADKLDKGGKGRKPKPE